MHLHEYQSKELFKQAGIPTCDGFVITRTDQLEPGLNLKGWPCCVLKAQIHSGVRKKTGAVRLANSLQEANEHAKDMLGNCFITEQTGPLGKVAEKLLICPLVDIEKEFYIGLTYDRSLASICLIASCEGGIYIEQKSKQAQPQVFCKIKLPLSGKLRIFHKW